MTTDSIEARAARIVAAREHGHARCITCDRELPALDATYTHQDLNHEVSVTRCTDLHADATETDVTDAEIAAIRSWAGEYERADVALLFRAIDERDERLRAAEAALEEARPGFQCIINDIIEKRYDDAQAQAIECEAIVATAIEALAAPRGTAPS